MASYVDTATGNARYIGLGAVGGYAGAFIQSKVQGVEGIDPMGMYQVQSALAGGIGSYLWLLLRGVGIDGADTDSIWKPLLVGWGAEWVYNKLVRGLLSEMSVV